jgi:sugar phosphate isomerase/epimerase
MKLKPIALQLYSLREAVYPGGADLPGVLRTVADIGYKGVEFAGLYGNDPKEIAKIVKDLGLLVCSSHTGLPKPENVREIADTELTLGNKRAISGFGPDSFKTMDDCRRAADQFRQAAELLKPYGMTFGFHNHWWEFGKVDGKLVYDILMAEAPDVFSELDVYWCAYGKGDPVKVVKQYTSRQPLLHIKDGTLEEGKPHTAVGSGVLDIPAIVGAADPSVLEWLIIELDNCATDMLEAVKQSCRYMTSSGLAVGNK